jgi:hypothetical protein
MLGVFVFQRSGAAGEEKHLSNEAENRRQYSSVDNADESTKLTTTAV